MISIFGLAPDLVLGSALGLTSSSSIIVSITASYMGSPLSVNSPNCSLGPSSAILNGIYIYIYIYIYMYVYIYDINKFRN